MKRQFNKKRFWLVIALFAVAEALAFCLVMQWRYLFPSHEVSEIYTRYENVEGIDVSFIKDFQVNDTVFVDVTVLEATTDSAWSILKADYGVPQLTPQTKSLMEKGSPCIAFCKLPELEKNNSPSDSKYTNDNTLVIAMHNDSTIYVFYSKTRDHKHAITDMLIDKYYGQ